MKVGEGVRNLQLVNIMFEHHIFLVSRSLNIGRPPVMCSKNIREYLITQTWPSLSVLKAYEILARTLKNSINQRASLLDHVYIAVHRSWGIPSRATNLK